VGVSEKIDGLDPFDADRMAGRILGMGDILAIVEEAQKNVDIKEAEKLVAKIKKGGFDLSDFRSQITQMRNMGGLSGLVDKLPAQMAQATGLNVADVAARYEAAIAPPPAPVDTPPPAPTLTVEDLYRQYAGREADPGGLAFWKQGFGDSIDASEIASFQNAVAGARAQGTEPAAAAPVATTPAVTQGALSTVTTPAATPTVSKEDAVAKITQQILAQGTADKWSGEGKGTAEKNAADMAKIIADTGATDIKDFGKVAVLAQVDALGQTYNGQFVGTQDNGDGTTTKVISVPSGQYDLEGNEYYKAVAVPKDAKLETLYGMSDGGEGTIYVDPAKVKIVDGKA
jgi:hypothetical protein